MQSKAKITILACFLIATVLLAYSLLSNPGPETSEREVNVCLHIWDYTQETLSYLKDLNVKWVRTDWVNAPNNLMVEFANTLENNSINLLAIIDFNTFNQTTPTLQEWNNTVTEIVSSKDFESVDAVEIWNEPNGNASIESETYYEMLKIAYTIIKNYTTIPVVFAGISPNIGDWQNYLNIIFAHDDTEDYFDYMGIHFYDDMKTNKDTLSFIEDLTTKPIWLTETGKPSATENHNEISQAEYLRDVCSTFKPLVDEMFIYELMDNSGLPEDKESHFGLLTVEGTHKEAYWIIYDINKKIE